MGGYGYAEGAPCRITDPTGRFGAVVAGIGILSSMPRVTSLTSVFGRYRPNRTVPCSLKTYSTSWRAAYAALSGAAAAVTSSSSPGWNREAFGLILRVGPRKYAPTPFLWARSNGSTTGDLELALVGREELCEDAQVVGDYHSHGIQGEQFYPMYEEFSDDDFRSSRFIFRNYGNALTREYFGYLATPGGRFGVFDAIRGGTFYYGPWRALVASALRDEATAVGSYAD